MSPTEEFVRRYDHLKERTANDPHRLIRSLADDPELGQSLRRLGQILLWVFSRRKKGRNRYHDKAHPRFGKSLDDFEARWIGPYNEGRDQLYLQALVRIAHRFLQIYNLLVARTGNMPSAVDELRETDSQFKDLIGELDSIGGVLKDPRNGFERFGGHMTDEFRSALGDFDARWADAVATKIDLDKIGFDEPDRKPITRPNNWLEDLLGGLPPTLEPRIEGEVQEHFDTDRDDLGEALWGVESLAINDKAFFGQWLEAMVFLTRTVGLDLSELHERWKQIPFISVREGVSEKHDRKGPRGLLGYLDEIRLAYVVGADLAAIALCRVVTEILIRHHYAYKICNATDDRRTKLTTGKNKDKPGLIELVEEDPEFGFLRDFKLGQKVQEANDILHANPPVHGNNVVELPHRARILALDWFRVLKEMIDRVP